jgi:hypothetical protein
VISKQQIHDKKIKISQLIKVNKKINSSRSINYIIKLNKKFLKELVEQS